MANVLETSMNFLQTQDPAIAACIDNEFYRPKHNIPLIASADISSPDFISPIGSFPSTKSAEGYPGHRQYASADYRQM